MDELIQAIEDSHEDDEHLPPAQDEDEDEEGDCNVGNDVQEVQPVGGAEPQQVLPSLQSARFRIEAFSFTDDDAMTENCTRKLLEAMPHAKSRLHVIQPAAVGLPAIGHVGAFRREASQALWPLLERAMVRPAATEADLPP